MPESNESPFDKLVSGKPEEAPKLRGISLREKQMALAEETAPAPARESPKKAAPENAHSEPPGKVSIAAMIERALSGKTGGDRGRGRTEGFYVYDDQIDKLTAIAQHIPNLTRNDLVRIGIDFVIAHFEERNGGPFEQKENTLEKWL